MMIDHTVTIDRLLVENKQLRAENEELTTWVHDLQSGMYINCVYCGHRYGPKDDVPATMQEALYEHIAECPKHPLSKAKAENAELKKRLDAILKPRVAMETAAKACQWCQSSPCACGFTDRP